MISVRRILVNIKDPAKGVTPGARKAAQLARALGAQLELFHAIPTPIYLDNHVYSDWSVADAKRDAMKHRTEQLAQIAQALSGKGRRRKLPIRINASWDWPSYVAVIRRAAAFKADLVVADRHFGGHFARSVLHFSDWKLLRLCPAAVLLVGASGEYRRPTVLAAVDPAHKWSRPAQMDARILSLGSLITNALNGRLSAVHTYEPTPMAAFNPPVGIDPRVYQELTERLSSSAAARFDRILHGTRISAQRRYLVATTPVLGIPKVAHDITADLVVIGAISRSGLSRLVIGSTAEILLDRLHGDLLIVKPAYFKNRVAQAAAAAPVVPVIPPVTM